MSADNVTGSKNFEDPEGCKGIMSIGTEKCTNTTSNTMGGQDLDLILNVEDHNLDFKPEEDILDECKFST